MTLLSRPKDWKKYYRDIGLQEDRLIVLGDYAAKLATNNIPVIFSFEHLAKLLGRTNEHLGSLIFGTESHYRRFEIKKRRGGTRPIEAPHRSLLECQRWIARHILAQSLPSDCVHSYRSRRNIRTNAAAHSSGGPILKMDIENFFPSISFGRVWRYFSELGYATEVAFFLARLCTVRDSLPQGGAASPALSNILFKKLDRRLEGLATHCHLIYTRYADDLTFSGDSIGLGFILSVEKICLSEGLVINSKKTQLMNGLGRRVVTGLVVGKNSISLKREYKREIRQAVYFIIKHGPATYLRKNRKSPLHLRQILGRLAYWRSIEPDNKFVCDALPKLSKILNDTSL
ncbi:reverse transcriptase domain-containing protein [Burkholderia cenocepacia]|uniref:reverse transcriptase domain-containing protein n=1 Tax=Burkholderia cenocepacia TaxID=95486 RepID=UPI00264F17C0|nr:reverse transcriptase domain-containing protein [Burkholderia cenocepacia]MDN7545847.1 reverse transcriptase domain-containing protein [Burkholderia cenocepacia]